MTRKLNIGRAAAIGGLTASMALLMGLPTVNADELADLRANQELLQRRIDQLAQAAQGRPGVPGAYGAEAHPGEMAVQRQLSALVSDPGHGHLDTRRRVCRRDPRLLLAGRPAKRQPKHDRRSHRQFGGNPAQRRRQDRSRLSHRRECGSAEHSNFTRQRRVFAEPAGNTPQCRDAHADRLGRVTDFHRIRLCRRHQLQRYYNWPYECIG